MSLADQDLALGLDELLDEVAGDTAHLEMAAGDNRTIQVLFQEPTGISGGIEHAELTAPAAVARVEDVAGVAAGDSLRIELIGGDRLFTVVAVEPDSRGATRLVLAEASA